MNNFSKRSSKRLESCHPALQELFYTVLEEINCSILEGHRGKELQEIYYNSNKSTLDWPDSKHNKVPSLAVDAAPYPIDWNDTDRFYYFAGVVKGVASQLGIDIRWGGDWDRDNNLKNQKFFDLPHFELVGDKYVNDND